MALEYNVTRIVSFGDDTDQFLAIHHEQRSDVILSHFCDRVEDRGVRVNGRNGPILLVEQLQYGYHSGSSISHKPRLIQDKVLMPISESACGLRNSMHHPGNAGQSGMLGPTNWVIST
jgi:hypothetical protein